MAVPKRVRTVSYNCALLDGLDSIFLGVNHTLSDFAEKKGDVYLCWRIFFLLLHPASEEVEMSKKVQLGIEKGKKGKVAYL